MRLDHLLSKEEEVRVLNTVQCFVESGIRKEEAVKVTRKFLVSMRVGETPVPIPNTTVKTYAADGTMLETAWESRWMPGSCGGVAQLGEHLPCKQGVKSSNLSISTQCESTEDKAKGSILPKTLFLVP